MMAGDIIAAQHFIENLEKKVQAANHNATGVSQKIYSVFTKHKKTIRSKHLIEMNKQCIPKALILVLVGNRKTPSPSQKKEKRKEMAD